MKEVEVKARIRDKEALMAILAARGVSLSEPIYQDDSVFVEKIGSMETFLSNPLFLRLRTTGEGKTLFTAKYSPNRDGEHGLVAEEHETAIADRPQMEEIIRLLGFKETVRIKKMRRSGKEGAYEFCLDEVEDLGSFIEVEKLVAEDSEVEAAHAELLGLLSGLGIDPSDQFTKRYDVMLLEKVPPTS